MYVPSAEGKLHSLDLKDKCSHHAVTAHSGPFYSVATCAGYLATGGLGDRTLKLWEHKARKPVRELHLGSSILRLCSMDKERIAALCHDENKSQSLRLFSLPDLTPMKGVTGLNLRSLAALPLPAVILADNAELLRQKNELIHEARSKIKNPDSMQPILNELAQKGFWLDAKLLQAESAWQCGKPLHELEFLMQVANGINISKETVPVILRLASLLEHLNEPELALRKYEKIRTFIEGFEQTEDRLKASPLMKLTAPKTVRYDISRVQLAVQEMEKDSVLGKPFRWRLILQNHQMKVFKTNALNTLDLWEDNIKAANSSKDRVLVMDREEVVLFDGLVAVRVNWLNISKIGTSSPSMYIDYAIQVDPQNGEARGYGIFNPNKVLHRTDDVTLQNALLAQEYREAHERREAGRWLDQVHEIMKRIDKQTSFKRSW